MDSPRHSGLGRIVAAALVALGIAAAGYLAGGRYEMALSGPAVVRLDKWTGQAVACSTACVQVVPAGKPPLSGGPDLSVYATPAR